jgi:hypothetical protein
MLFQVTQAGWVYEIEAPAGSHLMSQDPADTRLLVQSETAEAPEVVLSSPRALVRAAKDHMLGLSCLRAWRLDAEEDTVDHAHSHAIRPVSVA